MRFVRLEPRSIFVLLAFLITAVSSAQQEDKKLVGWQPNPSRRGALSIFESCIFTIVACTWSIQHLNVPAPTDSTSTRLWRRVKHALMTVLMPEIVLAHAIVERAAAIQSLEELRDAEIEDLEVCYVPWSWRRVKGWVGRVHRTLLCCCCSRGAPEIEEAAVQSGGDLGPSRVKWTLIHSYYANMGGLRIGTTSSDCVHRSGLTRNQTIAITTRQFSYLRQEGIVEATPAILEEEIEDKGKTDYFTKGLVVIQISWLVLSLIGRAARHLAISQLEIITVAFTACAMITYCFAWNKPQGVNTATTLLIPNTLDDGAARMVTDSQPKQLVYLLSGIPETQLFDYTLKRIHNGNIEFSKGYLQPISLWLTASVVLFGAIHLSAWNFTFPSPAERTLWRIGSIAITGLPVFFLLSSTMSSALRRMYEEVRTFELSISSLWEQYCLATGLPLSPLHRSGFYQSRLRLIQIANQTNRWTNRDDQVKDLRRYVMQQNISPESQIQAENFEWFLDQFVLPSYGHGNGLEDIKDSLRSLQFIVRLRERAGNTISVLERTALVWNERDFLPYISLVLGCIYSLFRILIIILSFTSLRAMSDSVYDTTWAKNIPSVQ